MKQILLLLTILCGTGMGQNLTDGLVAWYPLNGTGINRIGTGNNGALHNITPTYDHNNKPGLACHFTGSNSYISIESGTLDTQFTATTITAWINPYNFPASIFSKKHYSCATSDLNFYLDWDTLNLTLGTHHYPFYYDSTFIPGNWVHVAATWDGDSVKTYINGNLLGSAEYTGGLSRDSEKFYIGKDEAGGSCFGGMLDEVRIYNRALNESEIRCVMNYEDTVKFLALFSPNGGNSFLARQQHNISWASNQIAALGVKYSTNNGADWQTVTASVPAGLGKYTWTIPNVYSTECKIRLYDLADTNFYDISDSAFTIADTVASLNIMALLEGFYNEQTGIMIPDYVYVSLRTPVNPGNVVDSSETYLDSTGFGTASFKNAPNGNYYIVINHRNHIETWSAVTYAITRDTTLTIDFTASRSAAYGNNQVLHNNRWCIYGGDVNQDGYVDPLDCSAVDQAYAYSFSGYIIEDLNGDEWIDESDYAIVNRNSRGYIGWKYPPGGNGRIAVVRKWDFHNAPKINVPVVK